MTQDQRRKVNLFSFCFLAVNPEIWLLFGSALKFVAGSKLRTCMFGLKLMIGFESYYASSCLTIG